jgi:hypothetical protein
MAATTDFDALSASISTTDSRPSRDAAVEQTRVHVDQLVGMREGQRAEERGVDRAEDGGRGTDADRESHDRHTGEQGRGPELPERISNVMQLPPPDVLARTAI